MKNSNTQAMRQSCISTIAMTNKPMIMPAGNTLTESSSLTKRAANTDPTAMPTATVAVSQVACSMPKSSADLAQISTISLNVAPAPQNNVVTANETLPSTSRHSALNECQKSLSI